MKIDTFAPIIIPTYTRHEHFVKTIQALQKNINAIHTPLYIYSDATSKEEDEEMIKRTRAFCKKIKGFKDVHIIQREYNYGWPKNPRNAHIEITKEFGKSIFMEDDIVTAPGFINFMNESLEYYKDDQRIFNICGYAHPFNIPNDYNIDVYSLQRFTGWGNAMWADRLKHLHQPINEDEFKNYEDKQHLKSAGEDMYKMFYRVLKDGFDAADVKATYYALINNMYTLYPRKSLVQNIGYEGSGVNCKPSKRHDHDCLWDKLEDFIFDKNIQMNHNINNENLRFAIKKVVVDEDKVKKVSNDLINQIKNLSLKSLCIWGIENKVSENIYNFCKKNKIKIEFFIDSKAEYDNFLFYKDIKTHSIEQFIDSDIENIVITSMTSGIKLKNIIKKRIDKKVVIFHNL